MAVLFPFAALALGCASTAPADVPPWRANGSLARSAVPAVLLEESSRAANRSTCSALAFDPAALPREAAPRRANFSGGWAVAWDQPGQPGRDASGAECERCGRGVFGLAGTGVEATPGSLSQWENQKRWSDGSWAGWGLEGHQGPRHLAYVKVAGESCLYNVWSSLSADHLEGLIGALRIVEPVR
ncbi:MAG TPA: hypothetical protein VFV54_05640 [Thermoanaerobaculia bacterium]|nr:hypothetical protein [Thermoanaerobaculia bacterium]